MVYAAPDKICLISQNNKPTEEDLTSLNREGIQYEDIKNLVESIEFVSWNSSVRCYKYVYKFVILILFFNFYL